MHEYEIRILRSDGGPSLIAAEVHLNDHAAVRSAKRLAEGRKFEVWRDLDCIYTAAAAPPPQAAAMDKRPETRK